MKRSIQAAAFVWAFSSLASAQGLGTIVGTVTDPSGAVIPAAQVTLTERTSALTRTAIANADGYFVVPSLKPSVYSIAAAAAGFSTYEQTGITLLASQSLTVNVSLKIGSTGEKVTVEANAIQVNTTTGTLGQVIDSDRMIDLPLQGRNAAQLTALVAGAIPSQIVGVVSQGGFGGRAGGGASVSVGGSRQNGTYYQLDGATFMDETTNVNMTFPFPDALQEFSVQTNSYSAQFGGSAGGVVTVMTKSGSNEFHGNAFNFVRNEVFNARNFFSVARDKLKRNQPGGTLGGPIFRNKTFFFVGYQGTLIRLVSGAGRQILPTPANVNGDFSAMLSATNVANPLRRAVTIMDPVIRQPFPGNMIPTSRLDPASLALLKFLPVNNADPDGTKSYTVPGLNEDFNEVLTRVDHAISDKDRLTLRYSFNHWTKPSVYDPTNIMIYSNSNSGETGGAMLRETHIFRPNLLNDFTFSYSRIVTRRHCCPK